MSSCCILGYLDALLGSIAGWFGTGVFSGSCGVAAAECFLYYTSLYRPWLLTHEHFKYMHSKVCTYTLKCMKSISFGHLFVVISIDNFFWHAFALVCIYHVYARFSWSGPEYCLQPSASIEMRVCFMGFGKVVIGCIKLDLKTVRARSKNSRDVLLK